MAEVQMKVTRRLIFATSGIFHNVIVFRALKRSGEVWEKHYRQLHMS